jgi:hypothetical protein
VTAHVQDQHAPNALGSATFATTISSTAGNGLVCYMTVWQSGNNPISISSIADNASGGTNVWQYSTAQQSQYPPAGGSFSVTESQYGFTAMGVCLPSAQPTRATKAVTQVTVTFSAAVTSFGEVGVSEFSGLPAGSVLSAAAASGTLATAATSYTTPAIAVPSTALVVANTSFFNQWTGVTSGYTLLSYADTLGAYDVAVAPGSRSVAFTGTPAGDVPSSAIVAIGPAGSPRLLAATPPAALVRSAVY